MAATDARAAAISRERVRQIEDRAIQRLRRILARRLSTRPVPRQRPVAGPRAVR